jgi:transposase InsO family protein
MLDFPENKDKSTAWVEDMAVLFFLWAGWIFYKRWQLQRLPARFGWRGVPEVNRQKARAKPPWVTREVLHLKALMPDAGCRRIADLFNRRFARMGVRVGKTFVSDKIRANQLEILHLRREIRSRKPKASAPNRVWGLDLTGKTDSQGNGHAILALVDHGSRANLRLVALTNKSATALLREVGMAIARYGRPRFIRTDNEPVFRSRRFRLGLAILGVRHQRIDPGCPWQNGRVERFFGTLKKKLDPWSVDSLAELNGALGQFRLWYNHIRPHQALEGRTPAEVWAGETVIPRFRKEYWFEAWDGLLQGFYLSR